MVLKYVLALKSAYFVLFFAQSALASGCPIYVFECKPEANQVMLESRNRFCGPGNWRIAPDDMHGLDEKYGIFFPKFDKDRPDKGEHISTKEWPTGLVRYPPRTHSCALQGRTVRIEVEAVEVNGVVYIPGNSCYTIAVLRTRWWLDDEPVVKNFSFDMPCANVHRDEIRKVKFPNPVSDSASHITGVLDGDTFSLSILYEPYSEGLTALGRKKSYYAIKRFNWPQDGVLNNAAVYGHDRIE